MSDDLCECNLCAEAWKSMKESVNDSLIKQLAVMKSDLRLSQLTLAHALAANDKLRIEKELLLTLVRK